MGLIPDEYMRPEMMAIGDSLYQGVRSLTIKSGMMKFSAPAMVSEALGIRHRFSCPDPLQPIIIDMEQWLRWFPDMGAIRDDIAENTRYWLKTPKSPSGRLFFENVAVASATVADLYTDTWRRANTYVKAQPSNLPGRFRKFDFNNIDLSRLMQMMNTRFTLNPSGDLRFADLSQVGIVEHRLPKRLLVNIGANNGLWDIALEGNPAGKLDMADEMKILAHCLSKLPKDVKSIFFNMLPPPSTVPNLMPLPDYVERRKKPGEGNYYDLYENRFGFGYGTITGKQMADLDAMVAKANAETQSILRAAFGSDRRLHFVDLSKLMRSYDSKHQKRTTKNVVKLKNKKTLTNVTTEANPIPFPAFARGGFQGLDGMHPTVVGYALMAREVLRSIADASGSARPKTVNLDQAFRRDGLLTDMPRFWSLGLWIWRDIRRGMDRDETDPDTDRTNAELAEVLGCAASSARVG